MLLFWTTSLQKILPPFSIFIIRKPNNLFFLASMFNWWCIELHDIARIFFQDRSQGPRIWHLRTYRHTFCCPKKPFAIRAMGTNFRFLCRSHKHPSRPQNWWKSICICVFCDFWIFHRSPIWDWSRGRLSYTWTVDRTRGAQYPNPLTRRIWTRISRWAYSRAMRNGSYFPHFGTPSRKERLGAQYPAPDEIREDLEWEFPRLTQLISRIMWCGWPCSCWRWTLNTGICASAMSYDPFPTTQPPSAKELMLGE